ncbi:MAG: hypothetical protein GWN87_24925 [Desulfuromonadales bacterium]|nr:hypothetical protein [Desulfuromonadales bacterium]
MKEVLKNEVAIWALNQLKAMAEIEFADRVATLEKGGPYLPSVDNAEPRFKAYAQAVEVAGRLELTARAYRDPCSKLPSDEEGADYVTHAAAMVAQEAEPVRCATLTRVVNALCNCGGGPPGECCLACEVYHRVKVEQGGEEEGAGDGRHER